MKTTVDAKYRIKDIFRDHFADFWKENAHKFPESQREQIQSQVKKMIECGDPKGGYIKYKCTHCAEEKTIGFTCKSRFCNSCGKRYSDEWSDKQQSKLLDVIHRHCVFTIPEEFRAHFFYNKNCLKDLQVLAWEVVEETINRVNGKNREVYDRRKRRKQKGLLWQTGMISVVHTFGRDLKYNPHVHALIPEIKMKGDEIGELNYFNYTSFRKIWQYKLIQYMIKKNPHKSREYSSYFKRYKDGFYVYAEGKMKSAKKSAQYIGRYLARPAMAEHRIIEVTEREIRYWYIDHKSEKREEVTESIHTFMGKLIQHIPMKNQKLVRRYGIYSGRTALARKRMYGLQQYIKSGYRRTYYTNKSWWNKSASKKSYRQRLIQNFSKDPMRCKKCKHVMELWEIWHPKYGLIYDVTEDCFTIPKRSEEKWMTVNTPSHSERMHQLSMFSSDANVVAMKKESMQISFTKCPHQKTAMKRGNPLHCVSSAMGLWYP